MMTSLGADTSLLYEKFAWTVNVYGIYANAKDNMEGEAPDVAQNTMDEKNHLSELGLRSFQGKAPPSNLSRSPMAARDCPVNRAVIARRLGGFTGEEQSLLERGSQRCLRSVGANLTVTVGSPRKRVGLPVVETGFEQRLLDDSDANTQQSGQSLACLFSYK